MTRVWLLGFSIGFVTSSPAGPIGLMCLRRMLARGAVTGLISALGVALAYAFWAFVAVHGLAAAAEWIEREEIPLESAIGLFFVLYGLNGIFNAPRVDYPTLRRRGGAGEFLSSFLVVFLNPATFIMFSALFTLFGVAGGRHGLVVSLAIALAVFVGATAFWLVMTQITRRIRSVVHPVHFGMVARWSSAAILSFGAAILVHALFAYLRLAAP